MNFQALQLFLTFASVALGATDSVSDVIELTAETFAKQVGDHSVVLAEFFAPWCGHCKNLAPEYEVAASELKKSSEDIVLAKIDCTENQELCQMHEIGGFPTLLVFEEGEQTGKYQGPRNAEDIKKFMLKRAAPVVTEIPDQKALYEWLSKNAVDSPVTFLYLGSKDVDAYKAVAKQNRERLSFLTSADAGLRKKYGSDLVVLREGDSDPIGVDGPFTEESFTEFVRANEFPSFGELGPDTYSAYIESGTPMLYALVTDDESRELVKSSLTPILSEIKGKANVVFLDANLYGMHAENLNLKQEFPAVAVHDTQSNKKYIHAQDKPLTKNSLSEFVKQFIAGEIQPFLKSAPVPEKQDEPVYVLVGSEYDEVVLNNDKDVLVEYYAPWCGHCKNLKPVYEELAELYADSDKVVIAKLDHTANEVPDQILGYPTIKLYPAGNKSEPISFEDQRELDSFIKFIKEKGTHKVDPKDLKKDSSKQKSSEKKPALNKQDEKNEL